MAAFECPVCHGRYLDPQPDGSRYFHACPPLSIVELLALTPDQARALAPELPANYTRADLDVLLATRPIERPGARNENVARDAPPVGVKPGEVPDYNDRPRIAADRRLADRITR